MVHPDGNGTENFREDMMSNVTKKDLVEKISERTGLTQVDTKIVVESFLDSVAHALQEGTNQYIQVQEGFKPVFEASKELRNKVNTASGLAQQQG
jgi:nucleoid DNA-binding protein